MIPTLLFSTAISLIALPFSKDPPVRVRIEKVGPPVSEDPDPALRVEETAQGKLVVVDPGITLEALVRRGGEVLGRVYLYKADCEHILRSSRLGTTSPSSVPVADFEPWLEGVLLRHDFVTLLPPEGSPEPVHLVNLRGTDRSGIARSALFVPPEDVPRFRHPGTLIRTVVPLTYLEAARAATNLRPWMTDPNLENISTLGNSNSVVIQGLPRTVATMLAILKIGDAKGPEGARLPVVEGDRTAAGDAAGVKGEVSSFEVRLRRLEEAAEALQAAIRNLAAESRP